MPAPALWFELCKLEEESAQLRRVVRSLQEARHVVPRREQRDLETRLRETKERRAWVEERVRSLEDEHRRRREAGRGEEQNEHS